MRLTLLAALISAVLASHASAQISAGPMGPFAVVDANGKLLGGWLTDDGGSTYVSISTSSGAAFIELTNFDQPSLEYSLREATFLYFRTNDCTGQVYYSTSIVHPNRHLDGGPLLLIGPESKLYEVSVPPILPSSEPIYSRLQVTCPNLSYQSLS